MSKDQHHIYKPLAWIMLLVLFMVWPVFGAGNKPTPDKTTLVIVHPDRGALQSFLELLDRDIITIPDLQIMALYYAKADYDLTRINDYIDSQPDIRIEMRVLTGDLDEHNLFQTNSLSSAFEEVFNQSEGTLFLGGGDFPPAIYSQKTHLLTHIYTPYRHYFELSFLFHLLGGAQNQDFVPLLDNKPDYVVNGFCLGMQSMNVAAGGTMYQDIPLEIYGRHYVEDVLTLSPDQQHRNYWRNFGFRANLSWANFHRLRFSENALFTVQMALDTGDHPRVCSSHHQAVKELGQGFRIAATTLDGKVVEAISHDCFVNVYGVQFHPEPSSLYDPQARSYRFSLPDTSQCNYYELLNRDNSYQFHRRYWAYFSQLFYK